MLQYQQQNQQKWEEAKIDRIQQDQLFKMKKFQNVQSKVRNELSERERKDDLKPMTDLDDRNLLDETTN